MDVDQNKKVMELDMFKLEIKVVSILQCLDFATNILWFFGTSWEMDSADKAAEKIEGAGYHAGSSTKGYDTLN